jgi:gamma-glutamyltranspeptidase/glutathione hydrolase
MSSAERGVVAAGHPLTARAGAEVLRAGGNAVDATIGAMLTSFVAEALLTGLGAGGYMMVAGPGVEPTLLDFFAAAPTRLGDGSEVELLALEVSFGDAEQTFHVGPASCAAYGTPAGVCEASRRWGSIPLAQLAAPAVRLAREGVALNGAQAYIAQLLEELLTSTPECAALWAPAGRVLRDGETFRSDELGTALERLGAEGEEPFYRGEVAAAVCEWLGRRGGSLRAQDLADYRAIAREPIRIGYRDRVIHTNPPPAAGGTLLAYALGLLDREPAPPSLSSIVAAMEAAQSERTPGFLEGLGEAGFLARFMGSRLGSTTHIAVIDGAGLACSATCTNGECSGVIVPGTGVHLNNMMGEEDLNPLGFHLHPAGRRLPSMMAPTVVTRAGGVELVLGSAGSNRIRSALLQTIVAVIDRGMGATEAVEAPRVHFENGVVFAEPGIALEELEPASETVRFGSPNMFFGGVQAALSRDGRLSGAGDPRRGGVAVLA